MNNLKAALFFIFFIFIVAAITTKVAGQIKPLGKIPTQESCNCTMYKGFKQVTSAKGNLTIKDGIAVVYADAIVFEIDGKGIVLVAARPGLYIDTDKKDIWLEVKDNDGFVSYQNKKVIYYYSLKGELK